MKPRFFELAKKLAEKSTHEVHQLGCVIVKKNRIVSLGYNQLKTHPRSNFPYKTLHAETHAVLGTPVNDLQGATAYVYRAHKDGSTALARPCSYCYRMLALAGIKKICYTSENGYQEEIL